MLLGHDLWQRRFASDREVLGRRVAIDGEAATVIGVLPARYRPLLGRGDLWMPLVVDPADEHLYRENFNYAVFGLLAPGRDPAAATAELSAFLDDVERRELRAPSPPTSWPGDRRGPRCLDAR
ncbi:MAG: ABC transporter permease [Thermoanaerobaculia bacterium]